MTLIYILITIVILGALILVHEFGHFIAARHFGVKVKEFALGMGPVLLKKETEKTLYTVRAFPIGGYCSLQGESDEEVQEEVELLDGSVSTIDVPQKEEIDPNESFINKPVWQRLIILAAGVTMNFVTAIIIYYIALVIAGVNPITAVPRAFSVFFQTLALIFESLKMLFTGEVGVSELTGPVGIVKVVEEYYAYGFVYLCFFTAIISVNLGIMNLLPIPALDGGQIMILLIEKLKGGELNERLKTTLFFVSYVLLIGLGVYVMYNDIFKIFNT